MYYRTSYIPRPGDYNRRGMLSYEALLQILEDASGRHSASAGDSIAKAFKNGIAWILTEWQVRIARRPINGECLSITTWVRGKAPASTAFRDFIITDGNGKEIILAEAKFALFDLKASRLTRIGEDLLSSYEPEQKEVFESSQRLREPSEYIKETDFSLRRSDIDFNGHVHNTKYIDFALQALPEECFFKGSFSEIRIAYKNPVRENMSVSLKYGSQNGEETVGIYGDGKLCCLAVLS